MKNTPFRQMIYSYILIVMVCFVLTINAENKFLKFIDTYTIVSFCILAFAVFYNLYLKGDFDVFRYYSRKTANIIKKDAYAESFQEFKEDHCNNDKKAKNTPLILGLFMLITAFIISYVYINL